METILEAFAGSTLAMVVAYLILRFVDTSVSSLFKFASEKGLEEFKTALAKDMHGWEFQTECERKLRALQEPVLEESSRVVYRMLEIIEGKFQQHYAAEWNAQSLDAINPERNKRDTAVYRFMRLVGQYQIYLTSASELPPHVSHGEFKWYLEKKVFPVMASGGYPGLSVMWRETIAELGDAMVMYSEKWRNHRPMPWSQFCRTVGTDNDPFLVEQARRLAIFFREPSIRLALLGVYLVDLRQDMTKTRDHERQRNVFLRYLKDNKNAGASFSVYGLTVSGLPDIEAMNIDAGLIPRNNRSFLFKHNEPHIDYPTGKLPK